MTFWNGTAWVPESPATRGPTGITRAGAWVATLIMVAGLGLYAFPFEDTIAASPTLRLSPPSGPPGTKVTATGEGYSPKIQVQVTWDGGASDMPFLSTNGKGGFHATFRVPASAVGAHTVGVEQATTAASGSPFTSAEFRVTTSAGPASVSPSPTAAATPTAPTITPRPTAVPTSIPTAAPTPDPTPTPVPAVTGIAVPAGIDSTGFSDASAPLQTWLATVPDGSTILFGAGATYRMDKGLRVAPSRHDLTFEGNGATLRSNGDATSASSLFIITGTRIKIRDLVLVGNSPTPGSYLSGQEYAYGVQTYGATDVEIAGVTIVGVYGDGLMVGGWSDGVWFHDSRVVSAGRNGATILAGRNVTIERVAFDRSGWATFDIEPWEVSGGAANVRFQNNTAGTWNGTWGFFFGASGVDGSTVHDVTVVGNSINGSPLTTYLNVPRRQNITFANNTSSVAADGPVLRFAHVDGLTVTGNIQPLKSGVLASITDSTGVTYP